MKALSKDDIRGVSMQEFLDFVNQDQPKITGGCVLLINAALSVSMVLMALKISRKKTKDPIAKHRLKRSINALVAIQSQLLTAAAADLSIFSEYLKVSKSKSKNREIKLISALRRATVSLLDAAKFLGKAILEVKTLDIDADPVVACDLDAGLLVLEASYKGVMVLAENNISGLPADG